MPVSPITMGEIETRYREAALGRTETSDNERRTQSAGADEWSGDFMKELAMIRILSAIGLTCLTLPFGSGCALAGGSQGGGGLNALATQSDAQNSAASMEHPLPTDATSASQVADPVADEILRGRVESALHSDPYFYDAHVTVSVEKGAVVLRGFVFSDWDLLDAIRIAGKAAGDRRVVDDLWIEEGGQR